MRMLVTLTTLFVLIHAALMPLHAQELSSDDAARVESLLSSMTVEEKVGQLFMISLFGHNLTEAGADLIRAYHPGAVAIFNYNTDFEPASQVANLLNQMQSTAVDSGAGIPLFIAADQEGGEVRRIVNDVTWFPDPLWLGAITNLPTIQRIGAVTGAELRAIGISMNLAPIADLFTREDMFNPNRVLHQRTFGDDPERVGQQVAAYTAGLAEGGVIGVVKHFPGHGGASDSHLGLPEIDMPYDEAMSTALHSFEVAVQNGVPAVMVGHLYYSDIEPTPNLPASLSPVLNRILRDDFGFGGLVMSDAMDMAAINANFAIPEAALMAVQAGVDMVVMGPNISWETQRSAIQRMIDAVNSGELPVERLDEAVRRILTLKAQFDVLDWEPIDPATVTEHIDLEASDAALLESYLDAATVVQDTSRLLPLRPTDDLAIIYPARYARHIYNTCYEFAPDVTYFGYTFTPQDIEYGSVSRLGREHEKVVIFIEDGWRNLSQRDLALLLPPEKTVIVTLGSPFDFEHFPAYSTLMSVYHSLPQSQTAACMVLFGSHPITGRTPIAVEGFPTGSGIDIDAVDGS